jgi:hypothetical protein
MRLCIFALSKDELFFCRFKEDVSQIFIREKILIKIMPIILNCYYVVKSYKSLLQSLLIHTYCKYYFNNYNLYILLLHFKIKQFGLLLSEGGAVL